MLLSQIKRKEDGGASDVIAYNRALTGKFDLELLNNKFHDVSSNGFLLDGFPRNINQAIELDKILKESNLELDYVFFLDVDSSILEKRITGRRMCKTCGKIYNIYSFILLFFSVFFF